MNSGAGPGPAVRWAAVNPGGGVNSCVGAGPSGAVNSGDGVNPAAGTCPAGGVNSGEPVNPGGGVHPCSAAGSRTGVNPGGTVNPLGIPAASPGTPAPPGCPPPPCAPAASPGCPAPPGTLAPPGAPAPAVVAAAKAPPDPTAAAPLPVTPAPATPAPASPTPAPPARPTPAPDAPAPANAPPPATALPDTPDTPNAPDGPSPGAPAVPPPDDSRSHRHVSWSACRSRNSVVAPLGRSRSSSRIQCHGSAVYRIVAAVVRASARCGRRWRRSSWSCPAMYTVSGPGAAAAARSRVRTACGSSGSASSTTFAVSVPESTAGGTAASTGRTDAASTRHPRPTGDAASSSTVPDNGLPRSITYISTLTARTPPRGAHFATRRTAKIVVSSTSSPRQCRSVPSRTRATSRCGTTTPSGSAARARTMSSAGW